VPRPAQYIYRGIRTGEVDPPEGFGADDFRVPTFNEAVERFPTVNFDIEIKGSGFAALPTAIALSREITALGIAESVIVVSSDDGVIRAFETLTPGVATSPGAQALADWLLLGEPLDDRHRVVQLAPVLNDVPVLTKSFWDAAARDELAVWVWMNDPGSQENVLFYQELIAAGAGGIIAGRPNEMAAAGL
jgi:glycerophosphoryl diester phosphodiesterase